MSSRDDDRFRARPGAPKSRQQKFASQVLKEVSKAGGKSGARLGRGHVAARFTGHTAQPGSRRVAIKTQLVNLKQAGSRSTTTHLRYSASRDAHNQASAQARRIFLVRTTYR